jgi:hypothetical protein
VKSLLSYGHAWCLVFHAGASIRVRSEARNCGATLAKNIISEADVALLVRTRAMYARGSLTFQNWSLK